MRPILFALAISLASLGGNIRLCGADLARAPIQGSAVALTPQNTSIEFVCAHVGPKPDPRKGSFTKFNGKAELDAALQELKSLTIDIDTNSLATEFDKLTTHLKSPDFFDVRKYPAAKFESTKIEKGQLVGKLTLHGVTKEIAIPATVKVVGGALVLTSEFTLDRAEFGMNFDPTKVENKVALKVTIGQQS